MKPTKRDIPCMTKNSPINNGSILTPLQIAYIAGFLDGDGSVLAQIVRRKSYTFHYQIRFTVSFVQKTCRKHFLMQLRRDLGKGTLRDRNDGISELAIVGWQSVVPLLQQLTPVLRIKLKQANLVLKIIEQLPLTKKSPQKLLELCYIVDQISALNDTKKREVTADVVEKHFQDLGLIEGKKVPVETFSKAKKALENNEIVTLSSERCGGGTSFTK
jgi:hypothetical protein